MQDPKIEIANWMENNWNKDLEDDRRLRKAAFAFAVTCLSFAACVVFVCLALLFAWGFKNGW